MKSAQDKAEGAIDEIKPRLVEEFDCKTIKAAKKLLAELEREHTEAEEQFEADLIQFEKDHGDTL